GLGALPPRRADPADRAQVQDPPRPSLARHRRAVDGWGGCDVLRLAAPGILRLGGIVLGRAVDPATRVADGLRYAGREARRRLRGSRCAALLLDRAQPD